MCPLQPLCVIFIPNVFYIISLFFPSLVPFLSNTILYSGTLVNQSAFNHCTTSSKTSNLQLGFWGTAWEQVFIGWKPLQVRWDNGDIYRQIALFYSLEMEIRRLVGLHIVSAWRRSFSLEKKFWLVFGFHRSSTSRHLNLHYLWNTFPNFLNVYWNSSSCLSHNPLNKAIVEHWLNLWHTWMNLYLFITATMLLNYAQVEQADSNEIETGYDTVTFSVCLFVSDIKWKSHNLNISKNYQGFHLWECFWDTSIYKIYMFSVTKVAKIK